MQKWIKLADRLIPPVGDQATYCGVEVKRYFNSKTLYIRIENAKKHEEDTYIDRYRMYPQRLYVISVRERYRMINMDKPTIGVHYLDTKDKDTLKDSLETLVNKIYNGNFLTRMLLRT